MAAPMPTEKPFAIRLYLARARHDQTQAQAAAAIGVGRVTFVRWETGKQTPPLGTLARRAAEEWIDASKGGARA
jgi:DNA-binding XRE family transcriptional regulator